MDGVSSTDSIVFQNVPNCHGNVSDPEPPLAEYSPHDLPWDQHRAMSAEIQAIYEEASEFENYAFRIRYCSGYLLFAWVDNPETGESVLRLKKAKFCRVRWCPTCQWRRSLMWQARFHQALPEILEAYPKARWLYLTLTLEDPPIDELADTLQMMNKAWQRFIKRKEMRPVQGWLRSTEITRNRYGDAHPHFHVLMMVPPSMLSGVNYVKQSRWTDLWKECLQVSYRPNVDIRTVKTKGLDPQSKAEALKGGVKETLKYSTKPADMVADHKWFLELTRQCRNKRFIASGGALKNVLKADQESDEDLALANEETEGDEDKDSPMPLFTWRPTEKRYRYKTSGNHYAD